MFLLRIGWVFPGRMPVFEGVLRNADGREGASVHSLKERIDERIIAGGQANWPLFSALTRTLGPVLLQT